MPRPFTVRIGLLEPDDLSIAVVHRERVVNSSLPSTVVGTRCCPEGQYLSSPTVIETSETRFVISKLSKIDLDCVYKRHNIFNSKVSFNVSLASVLYLTVSFGSVNSAK